MKENFFVNFLKNGYEKLAYENHQKLIKNIIAHYNIYQYYMFIPYIISNCF